MNTHAFVRLLFFGLIALIILSVVAAFAAGMVIEPSNLDKISLPVTAENLKPHVCTMTLTDIVRGAGTITGTGANELILGSSSSDSVDGGGGDDCILGNGGDDNINGGDGNDHIIGGDGNDTCTGGPGTNSFETCETVNDP